MSELSDVEHFFLVLVLVEASIMLPLICLLLNEIARHVGE